MPSLVSHKSFASFDFEGVRIDGATAGMSGVRFGYLQDARGDRIKIETPAMRIAWNAEPRTPHNQPDASIGARLALSFGGMESEGGQRVKAFHDFLFKMDDRVLALVKEKKGALWAKAMPDAKIDSVYVPSVKEPSDPKYDQTFAAKIPLEDNPSPASDSPRDLKTMKISVFNTAKKAISPTECKAGCLASAIVEASYIWCAPGMVGVTWTVRSVLVKPRKPERTFQFTDVEGFESDGSGASSTVVSGDKNKKRRLNGTGDEAAGARDSTGDEAEAGSPDY
ncbi:unnamed protein product [Ectocarpus sp. CCAP 1310/34]|nr:unnamed protein product [Ectocarpus sp. CCAP 1310/34]